MKNLICTISFLLAMAFVWTGCSKTEDQTDTKFTVSFDSQGGSAVSPVEVIKGNKINKPTNPTNGVLLFVNWYKDAACTNVWNFDSNVVNADITLYAKWTTATKATLQALVDEAHDIDRGNYTEVSYGAMAYEREVAESVLSNPEATSAQIIAAYNALQAAINALETLSRVEVEVVSILIYNTIIDGFIYVTPGEYFSLEAYACDANENTATDSRVTFTYDESKLNGWAEHGSIETYDNFMLFDAKSTITAGQTISIVIKSVSKPAISRTVTLKIIAPGALKAEFLSIVNALPAPELISHEHIKNILRARDLYDNLTYEERQEREVEAAYSKMCECENITEDLPTVYSYSFIGNTCTLTNVYDDDDEIYVLDYVASGAFPQGAYTSPKWEENEVYGYNYNYNYYQPRFVFKSGGVVVIEQRSSQSADGSNPTAWEVLYDATYTFTGTKATGGHFVIERAPQWGKNRLISTEPQ